MKSKPPITLARKGEALFAIALPIDATAPEEYAAEELRRHLHEMIGIDPCVRQMIKGQAESGFSVHTVERPMAVLLPLGGRSAMKVKYLVVNRLL